MKKSIFIFTLFASFITFESTAKSTHMSNFFDTVQPANSVAFIKILSGQLCNKENECENSDQKKYKFAQTKILAGKSLAIDTVLSTNGLCVGCEYVATFYIRRDKSIATNVFPVNVVLDAETKERRLIYGNSDFAFPFELTKLQYKPVCNIDLKCRSQPFYRYVPEKVFIDFLLKFR
ncbi:MAG: hypothetical protein ABI644_08700 [Arenimonas sp.]